MIKKIIKNNGIYLVYLFSQVAILFFAVQKDDVIGNNYDISGSLFFHFVAIVLVSLGYSFNKIIVVNYSTSLRESNKVRLKNGFVFSSSILIIIGLITSILTIGAIVSPQEYLSQLFAQDAGIADVRQQSGDGGLGGVFKMLNYLPLSIYLISSGLLNFLDFESDDIVKIKKINNYSLIASIVKVLFSLDRLTIMAILIVVIYSNIIKSKVGIKFIFIVVSVLFVGGFITASRMDGSGFFDFLILYFKLSLVNFQLVIDSHTEISYGFQTFLNPFYFILKFIGINLEIVGPKDFVWNAAQYFNSYLFMDFSYFSLFLYPLIGYFLRIVELKKQLGVPLYVSLYFIIMFSISTFISVPFIKSIEFWLICLVSFFLSRYILHENYNA